VGSISHCDDFCAAVAASSTNARALGFDVEPATPLEADLVSMICSPDELERLAALPWLDVGLGPKLAFSAKEAFYKCIHPAIGRFLDFLEVDMTFAIEQSDERLATGRFRGNLPGATSREREVAAAIRGRWLLADCFYCGATLATGESER
jgi:4'-phosphopantetheinyl transferase EntD